MQIPDCLSQMSKSYLARIVDSIYKEDIPKNDEGQLKEQIRQNIDYLMNAERIRDALYFKDMDRTNRILVVAILMSILEVPELKSGEDKLYDQVKNYENWILEKADAEDAFTYSDKHALEIYQTVLEVALKDADISEDEYVLLDKLRKKLQISRLEHRLLEARMGMYPTKEKRPHSYEQYREALKNLQKAGLLFYCNRAAEGAVIALPEEIAPAVKNILGFEMSRDGLQNFHEAVSVSQLRRAAKELGVPCSGKKADLSQRLTEAGCKASEILGIFSKNELTDLCKGLPGVSSSGTKDELQQKILKHFGSFTPKTPEASKDKRALYYQYYEELAHRNNEELYRQGIIRKDRQMEDFFEDATRYLFEVKFGCELLDMDGTDHADGIVPFPDGQILLWDNKSKEDEYTFPKSHADQFLRYIRESAKRVNVFLVVVPEANEAAKQQAFQLKYKNTTDTDIAIIRARDLKFVAENWLTFAGDKPFNLNVFNDTGILERSDLEQRMKFLLG